MFMFLKSYTKRISKNAQSFKNGFLKYNFFSYFLSYFFCNATLVKVFFHQIVNAVKWSRKIKAIVLLKFV